jgi:diguanylate cyclase
MIGARSAWTIDQAASGDDLFGRIGTFLADHRLSPDPEHYAFAYRVLSDPAGPLAARVEQITDGGVRLNRHQIEGLGGQASAGSPTDGRLPADARGEAQALIARTQLQVEDFGRTVRAIEDEARGFGRDLAASAEAMRAGDGLTLDEVVAITAVMVDRVRTAEDRLQAAREEAAELRTKLQEAQGDARQDPLTGLPNRRALEEAFALLPPGAAACLALCDVDRFKTVYDRFGHGVGDRVLTAIGQQLASECAGHLAVRYGGEEFAVLFAGADPGHARQTLEAARTAVAARRFRDRESGAPLGQVTFSAGIGLIAPGEPLDVAASRVDRALYRAKAEGRNRIAVADAPRIGV